MLRKSIFILIFLGFARTGVAACASPMIGHVLEVNGDWFDERRQQKIQKGIDVCSDSMLVRRGNLSDTDRLEIQPLKTGEKPVLFACKDGVTCNGLLNLARVPVLMISNGRLEELREFLSHMWEGWKEDQQRLRNLLHRSTTPQLEDRVLLSSKGSISPILLFTSEPKTPVWLEFCRVRPGETCPDPAQPVAWTDPSQTIPLLPGFYKVVLDNKYHSPYLRSDQQGYLLVVDDETRQRQLAELFEKARAETYVSYTEDSVRNLITYLYYLSGSYVAAAKP